VVNAARLQTQEPSAAGSIASLFGLNFAPAGQGQVVVQLNGITAPVFGVTNTQIICQVPWELAGVSEATVTVAVGGATSNPATMPLSATAPGLFSTNAAGSGQGAILIANTAIVAAPAGAFFGSRPARRGEFLSLYGTGWGAVLNQPPTGVPSSFSPLSATIYLPAVTIGGVPAEVTFAGLAPGAVGLYQANVQLPAEAPSGAAVPVTLRIGGVASNTVTIAVQ